MMSAYSKSCGYKKISVHTNTKKVSFSNYSTLESVSKVSFSWIFLCTYKRVSVDGRSNHQGPRKRTQQVTTLLDPTMLGNVGNCCMQTNATTANIVGVSSLFWDKFNNSRSPSLGANISHISSWSYHFYRPSYF